MSTNDNGNVVEMRNVDTIILTYDRVKDYLDVGGKANSLDLMLDMLGRATRAVEARLRIEEAVKLQQALVENQRNMEIAASLRGGR